MDEKRINSLMKSLKCTREEAISVILEDEEIDKGAKLNELTPEQKQNAKKATSTGTRKSTPIKRERKVDENKKYLLNILMEAINNYAVIGSLKNETEFSFTWSAEEYTVKLIKHRSKK